MRMCLALAGMMLATMTGCASMGVQENAQAQEEKEYQTGSNIPRRNRTESSSEVKSVDPQAVRDAMDRSKINVGRGN